MSYTDSNLSDSHYGYDMVTAVSQSSVNATMMQWLSDYEGSLFTQAYVYDEEAKKPVLTDYDALLKNLKFDPFSVPANTPDTDPQIKVLIAEKFMFAFQIEIGLPNFPLENIPASIVFDQEGSTVTYNMVCKTFKIIDLEARLHGSHQWINLDQSTGSAPWQIQFNVNLNLDTDKFIDKYHLLPKTVQDKIKNLNEDMFSVHQLYLDLNAAKLSSSFKVVGLDTTTQAFTYLTKIFLSKYVKDVAKDGGILLGVAAVSSKPFPNEVALIPEDLNFVISSYKDSNGNSTSDFSAYTLNYLIMATDNAMPLPVPFGWNWLEKNELKTDAGSVAINRNTFTDFLNKLLSPSLNSITKDPKVTFKLDWKSVQVSVKFDSKQNGNFKYNTTPADKEHVLTYTYSNSDLAKDTCGKILSVPISWGNLYVEYTANSDIYLEGAKKTPTGESHPSRIKNVTTLTAYVSIDLEGDKTSGDWAKLSLTTYYNIGVDTYGKITVNMEQDQINDMSVTPHPDKFVKVMSLGEFTEFCNGIKDSIEGYLTGCITDESTKIEEMLNDSHTWVFPGGKTFSFQDADFSYKQDLIAHILYVDPSD